MVSQLTILLLSLLLRLYICEAGRNWDSQPISVSSNSTDENLLKMDLHLERKGRGEFGFTGTVYWNFDVDEKTMVEMLIYRSTTGSESDYKLTPWSIPKQNFVEYLDTFYKDIILKNFKDCSDLPDFGDKYVPPFPQKNYTINACTVQGDGLPDVVPEGFYKMVAQVENPMMVYISVVLKVTTKYY
ncbi:uncharacterized protein [Drosophila tropicalis]|uniref:uncharacterized protein n=1 Tax=Drosophila tropicalis TaxID=46794 RepID=UPI0035ABE8BF